MSGEGRVTIHTSSPPLSGIVLLWVLFAWWVSLVRAGEGGQGSQRSPVGASWGRLLVCLLVSSAPASSVRPGVNRMSYDVQLTAVRDSVWGILQLFSY